MEKIKTSSETLNNIVKIYFTPVSRLNETIVGQYSFRDIYHHFKYSIREYSITHSKKIEPYQSPSCRKLLLLNNISIQSCRELIDNVNKILHSHTDYHLSEQKKILILEEDLRKFIFSIPNTDDKSINKIRNILLEDDEFQLKKHQYVKSILKAMKDAELNQFVNNRYPVIDKLLNTYSEYLENMDTYQFKEKRQHLKKCEKDSAILALKKYIKDMLEDEYCDIKYIQWFLTYLVYGSQQIHILIIHSILGYKYIGATKLYQKLFCKDHSTGRRNDFLLHSDYFYLTREELYNDKDITAEIAYTPINEQETKEYILTDSNLSYTSNNQTITIYTSSCCYDKSIYTELINNM